MLWGWKLILLNLNISIIMVDVNEYTREITCEYKGEVYSVRDNGAVMRHAREGKKARN